jgi:hypothetical protein
MDSEAPIPIDDEEFSGSHNNACSVSDREIFCEHYRNIQQDEDVEHVEFTGPLEYIEFRKYNVSEEL